MITYSYICDNCKVILDIEEDPYNIPEKHFCPKCRKAIHRDWGSSAAVHIPIGFTDTQIRYDKSPSGKKHFY